MLQKTILFIYCSFLFIFSSIATSDSTTIEVWPAGTRLLIPDRVMESYQKELNSWSHPSVYLFANYFFTGPSLEDKRKETVYIPLIKEQAGEGVQKEVMMDIMNVRRSPESDNMFITLQEVNPKNILIQAASISEKEQNTDSTTQAAANCIMCAQAGEQVNNQDQTTTVYFINATNQLLQSFQNRIANMDLELQNTIKNFCRTCGGVDIADFMNYVDKVAKEQKIPASLLLSVMYKESSGHCNAKNAVKDEDENEKSNEVGLFQLNMKNSTDLNECKNNTSSKKITPEEMKNACLGSKYRTGTPCNPVYSLNYKEATVCLNNPYCNVEEAINQINCKWLTEHAGKCVGNTAEYDEGCKKPYNNQSPRMPNKSWEQMSSKEKNLWRSVLLAYQRGHDVTFPSREKIKNKIGETNIDDIWTLTFSYYGRLLDDVRTAEEKNSKGDSSLENVRPQETKIDPPECKSVDECESIVNSLSYVHTILDFEYKTKEVQTSLIDSWKKYRESNSIKCPEAETNSE